MACRFAERIAGKWRYVAILRRWFKWNGADWCEDTTREIDALAVALTRAAIYWPEADDLSPNEKRWICSNRTAGAVRALAASDRRISATPEDLGFATPPRGMRGTKWRRQRIAEPK